MANDRFTTEQRAAINATGRTIVSASAGSGKTTVMIEKIIGLILAGHSVSEILAVTFTKKAASQMKEKLRKAIVKAINDPSVSPARRSALKRQLDEVPSADISTIHSFCSKLIRTHFYAAGVDNAFRVINGDDAEGTAMQNAAIDELLDEGYEERDEKFLHLLSVYWRKKSDNALRRIFLTAYKELRNRADYREYLLSSGNYDEKTFDNICADLLTTVKEKCAYYLSFVETEKAYFESIGGEPQIKLSDELIGALRAVLDAKDYFEACALQKPAFTAKRTSKKDSEEKKTHIERLAALKAKVVKIYDDEFAETLSREEELKNFLRSGETAAALSAYLLRFDEKYAALKAERGALDYNDLEHKALALLGNEEIAKETREKYRFVFVDEYQDVNPVQEELISRIGGENLFLVGDVKQSIYGFRGSKSRFFVEKQKQFERDGGNSLVMKSNFRSSDAVLDAVNSQFSLAMTPNTSSVDYERDSLMLRGGRYALNDGKTQIHYLPEEEKNEKAERGVYSVRARSGKKEKEERAAAKAIRHIIEEELRGKWYDADAGEYRSVRYCDIAILSRKKQGQIAKTVAALAAEDVPVTAAAAVNICDYAEIKTLIDILSLLDNAEQDVPLCSALLSAMGNLTVDELAEIRLAYKDEKFFRTACRKYAEEREGVAAHKLKRFFAYFEKVRALSCVLDAGELLTQIITETRMEATLLSRENGVACLKRIHRFIEEATVPEPLSLRAFLERLRDLEYKIEFSENGGEDSVKVLTMHSSKGLEYPVVILDDLNAPFRGADTGEVLLEEKYGLAPRAFDTENMKKSGTLLRRLCEYRSLGEAIADELNLYYVALTRAKYSLHMLFKKPSVFPDVRYARSFADFTDFGVWEKYVVRDEIFDVPKQERVALAFRPNEELARGIMSAFTWRYAYAGYENLPVKSSATRLLDDFGYAEEANDERSYETYAEGGNETNTLSGLAYHAFLEKFDFSLLYDENGEAVDRDTLRERIATAYAQATDIENADLLSVEKLTDILSNEVFYGLGDMLLYKEQQFLASLPVKDTYAKKAGAGVPECGDGEEMLFQGAIDLLAVGEEEVRIIDYKYSGKNAEYLKERYKPQLELYRLATARIMNVPKERIRCTIVNIYRGFQVDID